MTISIDHFRCISDGCQEYSSASQKGGINVIDKRVEWRRGDVNYFWYV